MLMFPGQVERRIDSFVRDFRRKLVALNDDELAELGERFAAQFLEVDQRLDRQAKRLWTECSLQRYDFTRPWSNAAKARRVSTKALLEVYDTYLAEGGSSRRRLSTHIFSQSAAPPASQLVVQALPEKYFPIQRYRMDNRIVETV